MEDCKEKEEIEYTFLVTTFNQEQIVVETLESIKYQIITYAKNRSIQLIICDDASEDKTCQVVDAWLKENEKLFTRIDKIYHEKNVGTCKSYTKGIRKIVGKKYREMAGDDLLPANNIFKLMDLTEKYDIVPAVCLIFSDEKVWTDSLSQYMGIIMQGIYNMKNHKFLSQVCCNIQNGYLISKRLMGEDTLKYIERYRLIEDRSQWYYIFHHYDDLKMFFSTEPALLYRKSDYSVTSINSSSKKIIDDDMEKIYKDILKQATSIWVKWCVDSRMNKKRFDPLLWYGRLHKLLHYRKIKKIYQKNILPAKEKNERLISRFHKSNIEFLHRFNSEKSVEK